MTHQDDPQLSPKAVALLHRQQLAQHAIQTGVAMEQSLDGREEPTKRLRTGINSALCFTAAMAQGPRALQPAATSAGAANATHPADSSLTSIWSMPWPSQPR